MIITKCEITGIFYSNIMRYWEYQQIIENNPGLAFSKEQDKFLGNIWVKELQRISSKAQWKLSANLMLVWTDTIQV
jgi:hypothetical protein